MDLNIDKRLSLFDVSADLKISRRALQTILNQQNDNFVNFINKARVNKAKNMLITTDMNMKEIASKVGYQNANYFIKKFKKIEMITPGEFKAKYKTQNF